MLWAKRKTVINVPTPDVFNYLIDFSRHGEWDGYPDLRPNNPVPIKPINAAFIFNRLGSKKALESTGPVGFKVIQEPISKEVRVTDFIPNSRLEFISIQTGRIDEIVYFELQPVEGGTLVTKGVKVASTWEFLRSGIYQYTVVLLLYPFTWWAEIWRGIFNPPYLPGFLNGYFQAQHLKCIKKILENLP